MDNPETIAAHAGRDPFKNHGVVNPPVYHASTILFETYEDFKAASEGRYQGTAYGRHGTEPYRLLENAVAELEGADKALLCNSGVNAVSTALLALLSPGDHLLVSDSVYYPTREFCDVELKRLGVEVEYYDPMIGAGISKHFNKNTKVVFTESPGTWTFEVQDIPAISAAAHKAGALVVLDNTWASPLYFKAFKHGVDVSIHSATKYIGGHSDFMMGVINCTNDVYPKIKRTYKNLGICPGPDDVYLAQRGLRTMPLRLKQNQQSALELAEFIRDKGWAEKILHPAFEDCPGHETWKRDFEGSTGIFGVVLKRELSEGELTKFFAALQLFKLGYSYGGYESLIIPVNPTKVRTATKWKGKNTILRIYTGLENISDLSQDINRAFSAIS